MTAWTQAATDSHGLTDIPTTVANLGTETDVSGLTDSFATVAAFAPQVSDSHGLTDIFSTVGGTSGLGLKVEIEFVPGTWTDVTGDVESDAGMQLKFGRSSEFSAPQTATATFTLTDMLGNYTPKSQGSIYYPNVRPRRRVRISTGSGARVRFVGYIQGFNPAFDSDGVKRIVQISATDRLDIMSRRVLKTAPAEEILQDSPVAWYPLDDAGPTARDIGTFGAVASRANILAGAPTSTGTDPTFGATAIAAESSAAVSMTITGASLVPGLASQPIITMTGTTATLELTYKHLASPGTSMFLASAQSPSGLSGGQIAIEANGTSNKFFAYASGGSLITNVIGPTPVVGQTYHLAATVNAAGLLCLYVNGVLVASTSASGMSLAGITQVLIGPGKNSGGETAGQGVYSNVVLSSTEQSATRVAAHAAAALSDAANQSSGTMFSRICGYAGIPSSAINAMPGVEIMGVYPTAGKTVAAVIQDIATTEGGGAVSFIDTDGRARFNDRTFRNTITPALTVDALADLDGSTFSPSFDQLTLVNDSTVTATMSGNVFEAIDTASVTEFGQTTDSTTSFANTDQAALSLAQDRIARQSQPAFRFSQIAVDFLTAQTAGLYAALQAVTIGSRIRVTNIPTTNIVNGVSYQIFPWSQVDLFVEGWTETVAQDTYTVVFDTSPADAPARLVLDDTTYGRWQATPGTITVSAGINASVTSLVAVTAATFPAFTNAAGDLPFYIQIDEERLQVTAVSASSSPQTLTVVRGQQGSTAAAHATGAAITMWPILTWTL